MRELARISGLQFVDFPSHVLALGPYIIKVATHSLAEMIRR